MLSSAVVVVVERGQWRSLSLFSRRLFWLDREREFIDISSVYIILETEESSDEMGGLSFYFVDDDDDNSKVVENEEKEKFFAFPISFSFSFITVTSKIILYPYSLPLLSVHFFTHAHFLACLALREKEG